MSFGFVWCTGNAIVMFNILPRFGRGPFEAVKRFLEEDHEFVRDDEIWKRQLFSFHHYGWLRRGPGRSPDAANGGASGQRAPG
jgi:Cephalosporin hydroxylase